ncbi:MAG: SDR family NAD(P)-dependent oxidoreductase [Actinomycetota bacterium]
MASQPPLSRRLGKMAGRRTGEHDSHRAVSIVTGGASGIGRAIAEALARRGHVVIIADCDEKAAHRVAADLSSGRAPSPQLAHQAKRGVAFAAVVDVTKRADLVALVERVVRDHGQIDYFFNNAGIAVGGTADEITATQWDHTVDVNLRGVMHGIQAVLPQMIRQQGGHIVTTASAAGLITAPLMLPYTTTKHAVVALSKTLRLEVADLGVKVTVICPSFIDTPMVRRARRSLLASGVSRATVHHILGDTQSPDSLATAVLRGIDHNRGMVVFPRRMWGVVILGRLAPQVLERRFRRIIRQYRAERNGHTSSPRLAAGPPD